MSKQYYRYDEIVDCMKAHALDLIGDELNSFSDDNSGHRVKRYFISYR